MTAKRLLAILGTIFTVCAIAIVAYSAEPENFLILKIDQAIADGRWLAYTLPNSPDDSGVPFEVVGNPKLVLTPNQIVHVRGKLEGLNTSRQVVHASRIEENVPQNYALGIERQASNPNVPPPKGTRSYSVTLEASVIRAVGNGHWIVRDTTSGKEYRATFKYSDNTVAPIVGHVYTFWGSFTGSSDSSVFSVERDRDHAVIDKD